MKEGAYKIMATVKGCEIYALDKTRKARILQQFEGQLVDLYVTPHEEPKSQSQLGYLYGVIFKLVCLNTEMFGGWEMDELEDFFVNRFLRENKIVSVQGENYNDVKVRRISKLNKREMTAFIQKIINWLAAHEVTVPEPQDVYLRKVLNLNHAA